MNELVVFKKRKVNKRLKFISDFCGFVLFLENAFMTTDCIEKMDIAKLTFRCSESSCAQSDG